MHKVRVDARVELVFALDDETTLDDVLDCVAIDLTPSKQAANLNADLLSFDVVDYEVVDSEY